MCLSSKKNKFRYMGVSLENSSKSDEVWQQDWSLTEKHFQTNCISSSNFLHEANIHWAATVI